MLNFKTISKIFFNFLDSGSINLNLKSRDELTNLIVLNIKTNRKLWNLEDSARITKLRASHIATTKQKIDKYNQERNNLIKRMDDQIANQFHVSQQKPRGQFYSESPGVIIDRLAILHVKVSVIRDLLSIIEERNLLKEYKIKESIVLKQISLLGDFFDFYINKIKNKELFFKIQEPVRIYDDERIKKYIEVLKREKINKNHSRSFIKKSR